jgi:hypothetical protein
MFSVVRNPLDVFVTKWLTWGEKSGQSLFEYIRDSLRYCPDPNNLLFQHASRVSTVLKYESLQTDLDILLGGLGVPFVTLPVVGVTENKQPWSEYYDLFTRNYVIANCAEFTKFGYYI